MLDQHVNQLYLLMVWYGMYDTPRLGGWLDSHYHSLTTVTTKSSEVATPLGMRTKLHSESVRPSP